MSQDIILDEELAAFLDFLADLVIAIVQRENHED